MPLSASHAIQLESFTVEMCHPEWPQSPLMQAMVREHKHIHLYRVTSGP